MKKTIRELANQMVNERVEAASKYEPIRVAHEEAKAAYDKAMELELKRHEAMCLLFGADAAVAAIEEAEAAYDEFEAAGSCEPRPRRKLNIQPEDPDTNCESAIYHVLFGFDPEIPFDWEDMQKALMQDADLDVSTNYNTIQQKLRYMADDGVIELVSKGIGKSRAKYKRKQAIIEY